MDFSWTPQQQAQWDETVTFARESLQWDDLAERDRAYTFVEENWQKCAD